MRLFISHANADLALAQVLRVRLEEISPELSCFLLADDVFGGDEWEERIRSASSDCDGILSLVTARYVERPWFVAEWALFWFQDKPWYLLVDDVDLAKVFEPMRRRQASRIDDRQSVERLLRALPIAGLPGRPLDVVASELVRAVGEAKVLASQARLEANLAQFAVSLRKGTGDVSERVVDEILSAGGIAGAVTLALEADNSVALRQFAVILAQRGRLDDIRAIVQAIPNNAERRTVGLELEDILARGHGDGEPVTELLVNIYSLVREPQRRDLRDGATRRKLHIDWPSLPPNP